MAIKQHDIEALTIEFNKLKKEQAEFSKVLLRAYLSDEHPCEVCKHFASDCEIFRIDCVGEEGYGSYGNDLEYKHFEWEGIR